MKKIITTILLIFMMIGCGCSHNKTQPIVDRSSIVTFQIVSNNHQYNMFYEENKLVSIVHDPDCWCMLEYE